MMAIVTHVEVTWPFGRRDVMSVATYAALSAEQLAGTKVKQLTRAQVIARLAQRRRS